LIEATGLSAPTVGSLATALIEMGVLTDLGAGPSSGGRRPSTMELNVRYGYVGAIHLEPGRTALAVADLRGEVVARRSVATPVRLAPAALLARLATELRGLLAESGVPLSRVLAVGAGAPGVVDPQEGMVVALSPNLNGWERVPMADVLKRALRVPVVVENDVNLAVLGEHWRGAARGHDTCAFVTIGTGIGAGIMIGGQLHHGHRNLAGEVALMCMAPEYADHDFGARGCLETLAGLKALAARWQPADGADGDRWVAALLAAAESGDPTARKAVQETATLIGMAIANLSVVIDPSLIILGGPLFNGGAALLDAVRRVVSRIAPTPGRILSSELGDGAPLFGCLLMATSEARQRLRTELRRQQTKKARRSNPPGPSSAR
jgi:glucokinase